MYSAVEARKLECYRSLTAKPQAKKENSYKSARHPYSNCLESVVCPKTNYEIPKKKLQ